MEVTSSLSKDNDILHTDSCFRVMGDRILTPNLTRTVSSCVRQIDAIEARSTPAATKLGACALIQDNIKEVRLGCLQCFIPPPTYRPASC